MKEILEIVAFMSFLKSSIKKNNLAGLIFESFLSLFTKLRPQDVSY